MSLRDTLPLGTVIGEFEIRKVLGQGGFGIVYEAYEAMLDRRVALKEYFLQGFSRREGLEVHPADADSVEMFGSGMTRFIREARLLSMLNERTRADGSLVAVYRVFQAQRTAFMAMKLYEGQTMRQTVLGAPEKVDEAWLISLLQRMLDALHALHSLPGENLVHRDVSPDNIIIQPDGRPVLLDFGATKKASDAQTSLIYKPGYSPIEQYTDAIKQGPWTDLYALSGVAYFAIARQSPLPAVDRYAGAVFVTASEKGAGRFSPEFLALVDQGMSIMPEQRFQSAESMRAALSALPAAQAGGGTHTRTAVSFTRAAGAPTATFVAPPPTMPLTEADQGMAPDDDATKVQPPVGNDAPTRTWGSSATSAPGPKNHAGPATRPPSHPGPATRPPHNTGPLTRPPNLHGLDSDSASTPLLARRSTQLAAGGVIVLAAAAAAWIYHPWSRDNGQGQGQGQGQIGGVDPAASAAEAASASRAASVAQAASAASAVADAASVAGVKASSPDIPASSAQGNPPDRVPGLACSAAAADWACVLEGLAKLSSAPGGVALRVSPASAKLGDAITLDINPSSDGVLQILSVDDSPTAKLAVAFPNAEDSNNRVKGGKALQLPRRPVWDIVARPPKGRSWMIAVVSSEPIKLPANLRTGLSLKDAVRAFAEGQPHRLLGVPECTAGNPAGSPGCPKTLSIQPADFIIR